MSQNQEEVNKENESESQDIVLEVQDVIHKMVSTGPNQKED